MMKGRERRFKTWPGICEGRSKVCTSVHHQPSLGYRLKVYVCLNGGRIGAGGKRDI
jgi:hypothetical protein